MTRNKKMVSAVLIVIILISQFFTYTVRAESDTYVKYDKEKKGIITDSEGGVNVRSTPTTSTNTNLMGVQLDYRAVVTVIGEDKEPGKDHIWYNVVFTKDGTSYNGYVRGDLMKVIDTGVDEASVRQELKELGFPDSYIEPLVEIKKVYPEWKFVPYFTNYDWSKMVEVQMSNRRSLVQTSYPSSWKSMRYGDFDWVNNEWIIMEGNDRVNASQAIIEYYLDPRNFLDSQEIFQFELLSYDASLHNIGGIQSIVSGSFMDGTVIDGDKTYPQLFLQIGSELSMSPYYLVSKVLIEQGRKGESPLISGKYPGYEGYYNYFNIGATGMGDAVVTNGLNYAKEHGWDTVYKSLYGGASGTISGYIERGQNVLYLQKFDVVDLAAGSWPRQYAQYVWASSTEAKCTAQAYADMEILDKEFVFRIPIYENMPKEPCEKPTKDGNPNYKLKALSVDGYQLSPSFDTDVTDYSLMVDADVSKVNISAEPYAGTTNVSGTGSISLKTGNNIVTINSVAENGDSRTYTVNIVKKDGAPDKLQAMSVEGYSLSPAFNENIFEYSVSVPYSTEKITIGAKPYVASSFVSGTGEHELAVGNNTLKVSITGSDGSSNIYTINVLREDKVAFDTDKYVFTDNGFISGIEPETSVDTFLKNINIQNGSATLYDAKGNVVTNNIATGNKLILCDSAGNEKLRYEIVIYGDLNADGKISLIDYTIAKKYLWGSYELDACKKEAMDVNHDGKNSLIDRTIIKKALWGTITIEQRKE